MWHRTAAGGKCPCEGKYPWVGRELWAERCGGERLREPRVQHGAERAELGGHNQDAVRVRREQERCLRSAYAGLKLLRAQRQRGCHGNAPGEHSCAACQSWGLLCCMFFPVPLSLSCQMSASAI